MKGPRRIGKLRGSRRDRAESSTFTFYDICRVLQPCFGSRQGGWWEGRMGREGEGDKKEAEENTGTLSQTIPPFPHKYSYRDVSSLSISLTYRCILSAWYMCREKKSYEMLIIEIKTGDAHSQNPPVLFILSFETSAREVYAEVVGGNISLFCLSTYSES